MSIVDSSKGSEVAIEPTYVNYMDDEDLKKETPIELDMHLIAGSTLDWFEIFIFSYMPFSLVIGFNHLDDPDPTFGILYIATGVTGIIVSICIRLEFTIILNFSIKILVFAFIFKFFHAQEKIANAPLPTWIGIIIILSFFTLIPAYLLKNIIQKLHLKKHTIKQLSLCKIKHYPFGLTSIIAILTSPVSLIFFLSGLIICFSWADKVANGDFNKKALIGPLALLTLIWHLAKKLSPFLNIRQKIKWGGKTLYLRSYSDNGLKVRGDNSIPEFKLFTLPKFEEAIVSSLYHYGRVISVSQQFSTPPGAIWVNTLSLKSWKEELSQKISDSAVIALVIGTSAGIKWELQRILSTDAINRTVFLLPPPLGNTKEKVAKNQERLLLFEQIYIQVFQKRPHIPFNFSSVIGCHLDGAELKWYLAQDPRISGYSLVVSYMIAQVLSCGPPTSSIHL